jgi:hypothetical protein
LINRANNTFLNRHLVGKITSVFPPTTATGSTSFSTGLAPQQHSLTGWFMYLKELGVVSQIMTFNPRIGGQSFSKLDFNFNSLVNCSMISERLKAKSFYVVDEKYLDSDFTKGTKGTSELLGFSSLASFFKSIDSALEIKSAHKKFIYAYWTEFDQLVHKHGTKSKKVKEHILRFDNELRKFANKIRGTQTSIIVTADHGLMDVSKSSSLKLNDHPKLKECLALPFCGEPRTIYCYVKPFKVKFFEKYFREKLSKYCTLHKSQDLIKKGYFGCFNSAETLSERIGDYTIIMKENYIFEDCLATEEYSKFKAHHGGLSKEELYVPLILIGG